MFICVQAGPGEIGTELLMEPQHGHVWVERQQGAKDSGGGHGGGSFWMSDKVRRWFGYFARGISSAVSHVLVLAMPPGTVSRYIACAWIRSAFLFSVCGETGSEVIHDPSEARGA